MGFASMKNRTRWIIGFLILPATFFVLVVIPDVMMRTAGVGNSYHLLLSSFFVASLLVTPLCATFLLGALNEAFNLLRRSEKKGLLGTACLALIFTPSLWLCASLGIQCGHDLIVGPSYVEGAVELIKAPGVHNKVSSSRSLKIYGQAEDYTIGNINWFTSIEEGQTIEFICGPWTRYAFPKEAR